MILAVLPGGSSPSDSDESDTGNPLSFLFLRTSWRTVISPTLLVVLELAEPGSGVAGSGILMDSRGHLDKTRLQVVIKQVFGKGI
jgi:hypothetical protein